MSNSTLPYFWQLASTSEDERLLSSHSLVQTLKGTINQTHNDALASKQGPLFDDGFTSSDKPSDRQIDEADTALAEWDNKEVAYAIRRLIKGLASHRESARLGFSVALCQTLSDVPTIPSRHVVTLILAHSQTTAKSRGQEERDLYFARLFGLNAAVRSGILTNETQASLKDFKYAMDSLFKLATSKTWLRESVYSSIVTSVEVLGQSSASWRLAAQQDLVNKLCEESHVTPETVAVYIALKETAPEAFSDAQRLQHFASQDLLALPNLPVLARILRNDVSRKEEETTDQDAKASTGYSSLKAHFVWEMLLKRALAASDTKEASFEDVFRILVDESLFSSNASHGKKSWGFQVFELAVRQTDAESTLKLFTPNLMRTFINQLSSKDRVLNRAAHKVSETLQDVVRKNPRLGRPIIAQLQGIHGLQRFDATTGSKTVEGILRNMDSRDVDEYASSLMKAIYQEDSDGARKHLFDQLLILVRNVQIKTSSACNKNILAFFLVHGFFAIKAPLPREQSIFANLAESSQSTFSSSLQSACRSRFLSCLSELYMNALSDSSHHEQERSWIGQGYDMFKKFQNDKKHFTPLLTVDSVPLTNAEELLQKLNRSSAKNKEKLFTKQTTDFETMLQSSYLYTLQNPGYDESDEQNLLQSIVDCGDRLVLGAKQKQGEPSSAELLVHCVVQMLQEPSALLRSVATQAFISFSDIMTPAALQQLLEHLGFNEQKDEEKEQDDVQGESEDDEVMSDSISETSATSSSSNESDIDEKFADDIRTVLKDGGIADSDLEDEDSETSESSSNDEKVDQSDFDDEQMMLIDDKLADIFKQRFASRKDEELAKKETIAFHIKIVDLLDNYIKKHATNPLCIDLVIPLLTMALEKDVAMEQLKQRATAVIQKSLVKGKSWPTNLEGSHVLQPLEVIHKVASTSLPGIQSQLVNSTNTYVTRACSSSELQSGVKSIYANTLQDFIQRKANNLKPQFLLEAFSRFPQLGFSLREEILEAASGPQTSTQNSFRQWQALELLRVSLTNYISQHDLSEKNSGALIDTLLKTRQLTLRRASEDQQRIKEIIKAALHFVRLTIKVDEKLKEKGGKGISVDNVWPVTSIEDALTALQTTNNLPNAASVQNLLKQALALVQSPTKRKADFQTSVNSKRTKTVR